MGSKKKKKKRRRNKDTSGIRGELRRKHFESGGSLEEWRGKHIIHKNKKNKRNNRSAAKRKAIRESLEEE